MPSTRFKNFAYQILLPIVGPHVPAKPVYRISGHPLITESLLNHILHKNHILGGAVLISASDQHSLALSYSPFTNRQNDENLYFRVASITKTATALLVMRYAEREVLDLYRPVKEYLPECNNVPELEGINLFHLLSHTSGLSDPGNLETLLENGAPLQQAVRNARFSDPGLLFRYSNLGYGMIGSVLESVTGCPVGELFQKDLFSPLHINATLEGCLLSPDSIMPVVRILPYHPDQKMIITSLGRKPLQSPDPLFHYGHTAGSMYIDIVSLFSMMKYIRDSNSTFLSESSYALMKESHASYGAISPKLSYGLGLLIIRDPSLSSGRILGHQGFAYGCADGAFWEEGTGNMMIILNGGCSEARIGRLGKCNHALLRWAFRKELPLWTESLK